MVAADDTYISELANIQVLRLDGDWFDSKVIFRNVNAAFAVELCLHWGCVCSEAMWISCDSK
jgi:hypothetical protein